MDVRKVECQTLIIGAGTAGIEAYKSAVEMVRTVSLWIQAP